MKRLICIELLEEHEAVNLYGIRFSDQPDTLFDQFLSKLSGPEFDNDLDTITYWIDKIGEIGALERHFRPEGHPKVKAIPIQTSAVRLYCFRISDSVLILGGGDSKYVKAFQDDPILAQHVKIVKKAGIKVLRYIENGRIIVDGKALAGKLTFEIDI